MKDKLRNLFLVFLLLFPVLAFNSGYREIAGIVEHWQNLEQDRFANQKLGEVAANTDIMQHLAEYAASFKSGLASLLIEYPYKSTTALPVGVMANNIFAEPFPEYDLWVFSQEPGANSVSVIYSNDRSTSRRPMEMIMGGLIAENLGKTQNFDEERRNEKLLQKIFGNGCSTALIAGDQKGIATAVIYRKIPSFLVWDFVETANGTKAGFFLVVHRNQDLTTSALKIAAKKTGLGSSLAGGFVRIFASGSADILYPERLNAPGIFKNWRDKLGIAEQNLEKWEAEGFDWGVPLGNARLFTRILPLERHLAVLLLPMQAHQVTPDWVKLINFMAISMALLIMLRGLLLGVWPFVSIRSRFVVVFLLAATLPAVLYITSATAYVFERLKSDENHLEELLATSLSDFDAGKEYLENEYVAAFSAMKTDPEIVNSLTQNGLNGSAKVFARIRNIISSRSEKLAISGIALYDLSGDQRFDCQGNIKKADFESVAKFYGYPFTLNLRKLVSREEPGFSLPVHKIDVNNLMASQSLSKKDGGLEAEIERFRFRAIKTDLGKGQLGYIYDIVSIGGKNRYVLMIAWLDSDIDKSVIQCSANQLGMKAPQIKLVGFKRTVSGEEIVLPPDRAFNATQLKACRQIADSAFSIRSGLLKSMLAEMSVVAYASKNFDRTVLVGAIDHTEKNQKHQQRILVFVLLGLVALIMVVASGIVIWIRIVMPIKAVKIALDEVEAGRLIRIPLADRHDEIGLLTSEFTQMIMGLEERQRLASLLSEHALAAVTDASDDGHLSSQSFAGVVLISDIRDFTTMCELYQPKMITSLLNQHVSEMATVINQFGGKIYKFIGDAIEAVFVDDYRFSQSPGLRSALAAAAMLQKLQEINSIRQSEGQFCYRIGIGLAKGELIAGETGSKFSRRDYAMFGNAFKRAEEFESMTRKFPDCPLIVDRYVEEATSKSPFIWAEVNAGSEYVFRLVALNAQLLAAIEMPLESIKVNTVSVKSASAADISPASSLILSQKARGKGRKLWVFLAGLFCIIFPVSAWLFTIKTGSEAKVLQSERNARSYCENIITRLNVPDSHAVMLEQYLDDLSEELAAANGWQDTGIDAKAIESSAARMLEKLKSDGLEPSLFSVLHKPGGAEITNPDQNWKLVSYHGDSQYQVPVSDLLCDFAAKFYPKSITGKGNPEINKALGTSIGTKRLYSEAYARIIDVKKNGADEYLYWQPLLIRNQQRIQQVRGDFSSNELRNRPPANAILQTGIVLCMVSGDKVLKNHLETVKHVLENEKVKFAITAKGREPYFSDGFPAAAVNLQTDQSLLTEGWYLTSAKIFENGQENRIFVAVETAKMPHDFAWPAAIFAILALLIWHRTVFYESLINRRFAWQLWLGLLAAAVIPMTCVYTVNEWFAIEQNELRLNEERVRMIALFEQLERRQFMQETVEWDKLFQLADSPQLKSLIDRIDSGVEPDRKRIDSLVRELAKVKHKFTGEASFNEMILFSNKGWQHSVYPEDTKRDESEFKRFVNAFVNLLFKDLGVGINDEAVATRPLGDAVKDEMTRDAGLQIFRTMFGTDNYFKLVHGLDLQLKIFISTGLGCLKLIPLPTMVSPDKIIFWLFFDNLNGTMRRIFKTAITPYPVYTESKVMYGALKQPWTGGWEPEVNKFARWALATKAPLSARTVFAGRNCLVEARIGSHNEVMLMVGMAPEDDILNAIERSRKQFLNLLLLSLIAIVALTMLVSADIATPVNQLTTGVKMIASQHYEYRIANSRKDELGQMMFAFNNMARGLQEREVMGQMVSRAARRMAGDEDSLRRAEEGQHLPVTVLYLSVPGFGEYVDTMNPNDLIARVSSQIDTLCGIIINNGGEADKIIGEKILAYFYSPNGLVESNAQAVQTLKVIREAENDGLLRFPVIAGVHAGDVIAGLLGISTQRDFTIIGDAVNTAARICAKAAELERDRFLVSQAVAETINSEQLQFNVHGSVQLKGKAEMVTLMSIAFQHKE